MRRRGGSPELLEPPVPPAGGAVEAVADRVLPIVVLVVLLGRIERRRGDDLGDDRLLEGLRALELGARGLGRAPLGLVGDENGAAVLMAGVAELAVTGGRVDVVPEDVEQLLVADLRGIVADTDRLGVARPAGGHLLVGWIHLGPTGVAGSDFEHTLEPLEGRLHAPEAAAGE